MSTSVRVTCPSCGDLRLDSSVFVVRTLKGSDGENGEYRFKCNCGIVVKKASPDILNLLIQAGVEHEEWELPLELMEHPREDIVPPLVLDDLIELGLVIDNDEELWRKLVGSGDSSNGEN